MNLQKIQQSSSGCGRKDETKKSKITTLNLLFWSIKHNMIYNNNQNLIYRVMVTLWLHYSHLWKTLTADTERVRPFRISDIVISAYFWCRVVQVPTLQVSCAVTNFIRIKHRWNLLDGKISFSVFDWPNPIYILLDPVQRRPFLWWVLRS